MATAYKPPAKQDADGVVPISRIRITLTSKHVSNLEKGARAAPPPRPAGLQAPLLDSAAARHLSACARPRPSASAWSPARM